MDEEVQTMIRARRLFLVPMLSMFLLFIPFVGVAFTVIICLWWYVKNQQTIHLYFRGEKYNQNDINEKELEKLR